MSKMALINESIVTIYGVPSSDDITSKQNKSTIQDEALYGMPVTIAEQVNEQWVKIETYYYYRGYVPVDKLCLVEDLKGYQNQGEVYTVISNFTDVMNIPSVQGIRFITLTRGAKIRTILQNNACSEEGWLKVILNDGTEGFVQKYTIKKLPSFDLSKEEGLLRENLVKMAKLYLNTPYRWGGKTPIGIDCSGLCSMAYLLNNLVIYRDAKIKEGFLVHPIAEQDKKMGDLLYFKGHIAMYIEKGYYIHATAYPKQSGVVINSLDETDPLYRADLRSSLYAVGSIF